MEKIFAVGDVHGCYEKLAELIDKIDIDPDKDTLVFIGDYIDRGKESREVVDYIIKLKKWIKNIVCLMGNHEFMFMNYCQGIDELLFMENGGLQTLLSYDQPEIWSERKASIPENHKQFFSSLEDKYVTEEYIFVHAGLRPGISLERQDKEDMLWIRREFINSTYDFGKKVIFGHTPMSRPLIEKNKIGIDTGAVYGGKLTCVKLPDMDLYQV